MKGAAVKLADFGLAIEVQGDQQAWFGKLIIKSFESIIVVSYEKCNCILNVLSYILLN